MDICKEDRVKIYLAGNMHTDWRNKVALKINGCEFLWPYKAPCDNGTDGGDADIFFPRDMVLLRSSDAVFCVIENEGRNIGTSAEVGMAYAWGKPIILVNLCPDIHSFRFLEKASTTTCYSLQQGLKVLQFLVLPNPSDNL